MSVQLFYISIQCIYITINVGDCRVLKIFLKTFSKDLVVYEKDPVPIFSLEFLPVHPHLNAKDRSRYFLL